MFKNILMLGFIVILASTQTSVTPQIQACECANLLNKADCETKTGCKWTFFKITNTSNTPTASGSCANSSTVAISLYPTYCFNVTNITLCAKTIGCAFLNNTCQIFTGCTAYVLSTNAACQAISQQCITDGTRCQSPTACSNYTTSALCNGNISTAAGTKQCAWTANGTCADRVCSNAPVTFTTQSQCSSWIAGCLTIGKGCTNALEPCSSYSQDNGCSGMIGSDGPCTANKQTGSNLCRPLLCTDIAFTTNIDCSQFLTGCVSTGKSCVQKLQACSSYTQTQECKDLVGADGPCIQATGMGTACRALACTDALTSINTNIACMRFLAGCVTTGQGCTNNLGSCSSYTGTIKTCSSFIGTDGSCKGTSATAASCAARTCADAPTTTNTNAACAAYQTGCITNGFGCVTTLGLCSSYTGTNTTCTQYIGVDGNCTSPSNQTSPTACAVKVCTEAPSSLKTNIACQAYSYQCVTNGNGCVAQTSCEATSLAISCLGSSSCSSNQICLNRSQCINYLNQSQCQLNQQQYLSGGNMYLRACTWEAGNCSNLMCSSLSTSFTDDATCNTALEGCLTNGQGCVDINDDCGSYAGLTATCLGFKGLNGTQLCTQLNSVTDPSTVCVAKSFCSQAKYYSLASISQSSNITCSSFLSGCFFNGKDNCTKGDCTTYFGTQIQCGVIKTALNGATPQQCWKTTDLTSAASACEVKLCTHATGISFITNSQCNTFLTGCIWNGTAAGGCVASYTACNSYSGTLATCATFQESNKICTKTAGLCRALVCTNKIPPSTANTVISKGQYCQTFFDSIGNSCQMGIGSTCVAPAANSCTSFVAIGVDNAAKARYCQSLNYPGNDACGYSSGINCNTAACNQFTPSGATIDLRAASCKSLIIDGIIKCGLATSTAKKCSARDCTDYVSQQECQSDYLSTCAWNTLTSTCYTKSVCSDYTIQAQFAATEVLKGKYCANVFALNASLLYCAFISRLSSITCSEAPAACTDIGLPASISDQDKANICVISYIQSGLTCAYSTATSSNCIASVACDQYVPYQGAAPDNLVSQTFCQTLKDPSQRSCGFTSGTAKCLVPQSTCAAYKTYGTTITANQAFCSKLSKTGDSIYCASNTAGSSNCKEPECSDISTGQSQSTCQAYNSACTFDGMACIALNSACSGIRIVWQLFSPGYNNQLKLWMDQWTQLYNFRLLITYRCIGKLLIM